MTQDPSLHDEELSAEIRLVGDLVLAASQSEGHLSEEAIDAALGVAPTSDDAPADPAPPATGGEGHGSGGAPASGDGPSEHGTGG